MTKALQQTILAELPNLRRFAYSLTGIKEDADDLVQTVIEKLLQKDMPADANPQHWFYRICKNVWIDEIRYRDVRRRALEAHAPELSLATTTNGELQLMNKLDVERVKTALTALPENQRLALSLVCIEGLTYTEAAEVLDTPVGTIMSRLSRARQNLLAILGDDKA